MKVFRVKTTGCPEKNWLIEKNPHQNWVLRGQIFPWTWIRSGWSCLVLVRNDQKHFSRHRGIGYWWLSSLCSVHRGSSSILLVYFLGTPCTLDSKSLFLGHPVLWIQLSPSLCGCCPPPQWTSSRCWSWRWSEIWNLDSFLMQYKVILLSYAQVGWDQNGQVSSQTLRSQRSFL